MSIKHLSAILAVLLGISFAGYDALAFMKRKDKTTVFEVPTTGKIIDVKYHPEFDDWWVHCREGDNIVVYTYDPRNQTWAKVVFMPKKPDEKAQKIDRSDKTRPTGDAETFPQTEPPKPEQKKEPEKDPKKTEKKWWDPLKLLPNPEKAKPEGR